MASTMIEPTGRMHGRKSVLHTTITPAVRRAIAARAKERGVPFNAEVERALVGHLAGEYLDTLGVRR